MPKSEISTNLKSKICLNLIAKFFLMNSFVKEYTMKIHAERFLPFMESISSKSLMYQFYTHLSTKIEFKFRPRLSPINGTGGAGHEPGFVKPIPKFRQACQHLSKSRPFSLLYWLGVVCILLENKASKLEKIRDKLICVQKI